jgi:hypothetical protein
MSERCRQCGKIVATDSTGLCNICKQFPFNQVSYPNGFPPIESMARTCPFLGGCDKLRQAQQERDELKARTWPLHCGYKDAEDGCCTHPDNHTPECHPDACIVFLQIKQDRDSLQARVGELEKQNKFQQSVIKIDLIETEAWLDQYGVEYNCGWMKAVDKIIESAEDRAEKAEAANVGLRQGI